MTGTEPGRTAGPLPRRLAGGWLALAAALAAAAGTLVANTWRFSYDFELAEIPARALAVGLVLAGLAYLAILPLARATIAAGHGASRPLLALVAAVGLALRIAMLATTPALEDDYYRYLWDGAVTAAGLNPYAVSPEDAAAEGDPRAALAAAAPIVHERINHAGLKTIYPPTAQAAFALSHVLAPWSITGWRLVCIAADGVTLGLLVALLAATGRPALWVALYWWNPLVIKELVNSAHMEAMLMPLVLGALLLAVRGRAMAATVTLAAAAGAKLWPVILAPLLLRPLLAAPRRLAAAAGLLATLLAAGAVPIVAGGLDETSGFLAYAESWKTNSALMTGLEAAAGMALAPLEIAETTPGRAVRALLAVALAAIVLALARRPLAGPHDLLRRAGLVALSLFLLSPAQFPWYAAWYLPFAALHPSFALLLPTALLPVYYASFHHLAADTYDVFRERIVWAIWLPVWIALAGDLVRRRGLFADGTMPTAAAQETTMREDHPDA